MNHEPSTVARSLRAASLVITVVCIIAFSTLAYSFYVDYTSLVGTMGSGSSSPNFVTNTVVQGNSAIVYVNATIPNNGFYPLAVGLSCMPSGESIEVACPNMEVIVPPGGLQTLHFAIKLQNLSLSSLSNLSVRGNISLAIVPFVSLNVTANFGLTAGHGG